LKRSRYFLFILCWIGFICSLVANPRAAFGNEKVQDEILAMGVGKIVQGNIAAGKSDAISDAMGKAMEEYLILRLGEAEMINNFDRLTNEILPAFREGIENFHILAENMTGAEYQVLVRVKVNTKVLDDKLRSSGLALEQAPQGRVLFMVSEAQGDKSLYWWKSPESFSVMNQTEVILYRIFQERGFSPIDHTFGIGDQSQPPELKSGELDDSSALKWGKMLSADFVVTGQSVLKDDTSATLQLRVLSVKDNLVLGEGTETSLKDLNTESGEGNGNLLETAAQKLADRLIPSILSLRKETAGQIQHIQVTLKGIQNYKDFKDLQNFLKEDVPGVKSVQQSRMSQGMLSVSVDFAGSRDQLLHRLLSQVKLPLKLVLQSATETAIVLLVSQ
jgi:hypothetical protein